MRWSYKTEHFSLKKEGLLGSAFLDEAEIEVSLNEFGKVGWELVSFMEVNDGMLAVFKQPFKQGFSQSVQVKEIEEHVVSPPKTTAFPVEKEETGATVDQDEKDVGDIKIF